MLIIVGLMVPRLAGIPDIVLNHSCEYFILRWIPDIKYDLFIILYYIHDYFVKVIIFLSKKHRLLEDILSLK